LEKDSLNLIDWITSNQMKANHDKFQEIAIGKNTQSTLGYMTKTLNQIFFFSSTKIRIFFSATLGIRIFFLEKKHNPPLVFRSTNYLPCH
jgi:hypothetical protein